MFYSLFAFFAYEIYSDKNMSASRKNPQLFAQGKRWKNNIYDKKQKENLLKEGREKQGTEKIPVLFKNLSIDGVKLKIKFAHIKNKNNIK